jgi:hypothetical protein
MTTEWVITAPAERVELNANNQGEVMFTVSNPGTAQDRVVFELVPGDGASADWFPPIEEPQRLVPGGGSVSYLVKLAVPAGTAVGTYSLQGRAYSADTAPEEGSRVSGRIAFEVKPTLAPRKRPWWPYAVAAGLVVVVLAVVGYLVFGSGGGTPTAQPSASPLKSASTKPKLLTPIPGQVFSNFPRTTTLTWEPVPGATSYQVEVQCDTCGSTPWVTWITATTAQTTYTFNWVGAQSGRWRITANLPSGPGEASELREFRYTV